MLAPTDVALGKAVISNEAVFAVAQYRGGSGFSAACSGGILAGIMGTRLSREMHD